MSEKILYIIRGVPGSGKSTLANKLTSNVVEADQFMYVNGEYKWSPNKLNYAHSACRHKVEDYMIEGRDKIAVANTFIKRKDVKPYLDLAEEYGYKVDQRICRGNYQNIHNVPQETVEKMRSKFQESLQLNEGIEEVKKYFPKLSNEQLKSIIAIDPTYKGGNQLGQYSKWIIRLIYNNIKNIEAQNQYQELLKRFPDGINPKTGQKFQAPKMLPEIKNEDQYKIKDTLKLYDTLKKEIKQPLDNFKTLGELDNAIRQVQQKGVPTDELALKRYNIFQKAAKKGLKIVFEDDKWVVGIPTTKESSCMFGDDTSWCTTSPGGRYYEQYTKDGPLYINLNKETGKLYQFHFESGSFMNESDESISFVNLVDDNKTLKAFYYDNVLKVDEKLSNPKELSKYFSFLENIQNDGEYITGKIDFENVECYQIRYYSRDSLSTEFISSVLNGETSLDFYGYDNYSIDDVDYYCKKWKEYISPLNITWDDIKAIIKGEYVSDNLSESDIEFIQSLAEDFDDEESNIYGAISAAYESGTYGEMYDYIINEIKYNLPVDDNQIHEEDKLNIKINLKDAREILIQCIGDGYYDDDISFLGYWRMNHNMNDSFAISEPGYGFSGFDEEYWNEYLKYFADKIKEKLGSIDEKTHNEINEVLKRAGVQLDESFLITDIGEQIFYTKSDSIMMRIIKNKFSGKSVRAYYDFKKRLYVFGDAYKFIHTELLGEMIKNTNIYSTKSWDKMWYNEDYGYWQSKFLSYYYLEPNCAMFQIIWNTNIECNNKNDGYIEGCWAKFDDFYVICRRIELEKVQKIPAFYNLHFNLEKYDSITRLNDEKLEEMAYPVNFSLEQFSQIPSFAARIRYCNERLPKLGVGSSRIAYKVDDEKVLKIAKNNKGITQNVAECDWSRNKFECFAKIFEADIDNYSWVEMEIARKAKRSDFKKLLGLSFEEIVDIIYAIYNQYSYGSRKISDWMFNTSKENADKLLEELVYSEKNEYLQDLNYYITNYQPAMVQDWSRLVNWGIVKRNGQELPVIIDTGVTDAVYNEYNRR